MRKRMIQNLEELKKMVGQEAGGERLAPSY
jgi:hypothetical protein